jgi:hypothetical protein
LRLLPQIRGNFATANEYCIGAPNFHRQFASLTNWTAADAKDSYRPSAPPNKFMVIGETAAMFNLCDKRPADPLDANCNGTYGAPPSELQVRGPAGVHACVHVCARARAALQEWSAQAHSLSREVHVTAR